MDDAHDHRDGPDAAAGSPAVSCDGVVIRYGETLAVDRLSFVGRAGQVVALLGPNGAGKTSTVEALEGYRPIEAGSVRVLGLDPVRDHAALVARIGVMLQTGRRLPHARTGPGAAPVRPLLRRRRGPRRTAGPRRPDPCPAHAVAAAVRGGAAATVPGPGPGGEAPGAVPRRTHGRGGSRRASGGARDRRRPARQGPLRDPDHPRAGRGGAPGRPRGHHRPRPPPGRGVPGRAGLGHGRRLRTVLHPAGPRHGALATAVGGGTTVTEERPGAYRLVPPAGLSSPAVVATLAGWLAERDLSLGDLRTGQSLEEAYLAITGARGGADLPGPTPADGGRPRSRGSASRRRSGGPGR